MSAVAKWDLHQTVWQNLTIKCANQSGTAITDGTATCLPIALAWKVHAQPLRGDCLGGHPFGFRVLGMRPNSVHTLTSFLQDLAAKSSSRSMLISSEPPQAKFPFQPMLVCKLVLVYAADSPSGRLLDAWTDCRTEAMLHVCLHFIDTLVIGLHC